MATIAILGAGLGGVLAAYEVRAAVREDDKVVLVSKGDTYHFVPSNPWVAVRWRKRSAIEIEHPEVVTGVDQTPRHRPTDRSRPDESECLTHS